MVDVIDKLDREWSALIATRGFSLELTTFMQRHQSLGPLAATPRSPRWAPHEADDVLHALLVDCARGSYAAGRTVLQCMVPAMRSIVRRSRRHYPDPADLAAETTAAMWSAIVTYDLAQTTRVAMRLQGATLTAVAGDRAPHSQGRRVSRAPLPVVVPAEGAVLERELDRDREPESRSVLGSIGEVMELISWGVSRRVIGANDGALLTRLYAPDPALPEYEELARGGRGAYQSRVAAELGLTAQAARQRASRAIRCLAQAVHSGKG